MYNNLIPISLQVTLELVKFLQAYFINYVTIIIIIFFKFKKKQKNNIFDSKRIKICMTKKMIFQRWQELQT